MSHPRIEEVSDSDDAASDPSEGDIDEFDDADIMRRVDNQQQRGKPPAASSALAAPAAAASRPTQQQQEFLPTADQSAYAGSQCLYPVYFDASRTRAEGRRVPLSQAVRNPLAWEVARACGLLLLQPLFEPTKTHPKDWANPGRVRVTLKDGAGGVEIRNKHHLFLLVAGHLRANPTAEDAPGLRAARIPGVQAPDPAKPWPRPAVPRGWKVGELLPHYSPALTGGGVSENFLGDIMKEMQRAGGGGGGAPDMASMLAAAAAAGGAGVSGSGGGAGGGSIGGGGEEKKKKQKKGKR